MVLGRVDSELHSKLHPEGARARKGCALGGSPFCPVGPPDVSGLGHGADAVLQVASSFPPASLSLHPSVAVAFKLPGAPESLARFVTAAG